VVDSRRLRSHKDIQPAEDNQLVGSLVVSLSQNYDGSCGCGSARDLYLDLCPNRGGLLVFLNPFCCWVALPWTSCLCLN